MAVAGLLGIVYFLFAPISGRYASTEPVIYMVLGTGEQWGLLVCAPLAAYLIHHAHYRWAIGVSGILFLLGLIVTRNALAHAYNMAHGHFYQGWLPQYSLGFLHWLALGSGIGLLTAGALWELIHGYAQARREAALTHSQARQSFDPRYHNPQATTGFCSVCGAKNPLTLSKCQQCYAALPWAAQPRTGQAQAVKASGKIQTPRVSFASVDWGFWGIVLLSLLFWPLGLLLFFAYSRAGDDKSNAAIIGAGIGLLIMVFRFVAMMAKVGAA